MHLSVSLALCFPFSSHAQDSCGLLAEVLRGRFVAASGSSVEKNSGSPPSTAHPTPPYNPPPLRPALGKDGLRSREEREG